MAFNQQGQTMRCPISQGSAAATRNYGAVVSRSAADTDNLDAASAHDQSLPKIEQATDNRRATLRVGNAL